MSFLNEGEPLWIYLNEILHERGFALFDARRRSASALDLSITPSTITPEHRSVSIDDCSKLCKELRTLFLVTGEKFGINGEDMEMEISSPGVNRSLRLHSHFSGAVGERVKLVVDATQHDGHGSATGSRNGSNGHGEVQRVLIGTLKSTGEDFLELVEEAVKVGATNKKGDQKRKPAKTEAVISAAEEALRLQRIPLERVRKANVEFDFSNL